MNTVTIQPDEGNGLAPYDRTPCSGRRATVLRVVGPFSILDIPGRGVRACLSEYLRPVMDEAAVARRFGAIE